MTMIYITSKCSLAVKIRKQLFKNMGQICILYFFICTSEEKVTLEISLGAYYFSFYSVYQEQIWTILIFL